MHVSYILWITAAASNAKSCQPAKMNEQRFSQFDSFIHQQQQVSCPLSATFMFHRRQFHTSIALHHHTLAPWSHISHGNHLGSVNSFCCFACSVLCVCRMDGWIISEDEHTTGMKEEKMKEFILLGIPFVKAKRMGWLIVDWLLLDWLGAPPTNQMTPPTPSSINPDGIASRLLAGADSSDSFIVVPPNSNESVFAFWCWLICCQPASQTHPCLCVCVCVWKSLVNEIYDISRHFVEMVDGRPSTEIEIESNKTKKNCGKIERKTKSPPWSRWTESNNSNAPKRKMHLWKKSWQIHVVWPLQSIRWWWARPSSAMIAHFPHNCVCLPSSHLLQKQKWMAVEEKGTHKRNRGEKAEKKIFTFSKVV